MPWHILADFFDAFGTGNKKILGVHSLGDPILILYSSYTHPVLNYSWAFKMAI
jgi:hypothetical protein